MVDPGFVFDPPGGWSVFGTHVYTTSRLEFWGSEWSDDGMPIWERPIPDEAETVRLLE